MTTRARPSPPCSPRLFACVRLKVPSSGRVSCRDPVPCARAPANDTGSRRFPHLHWVYECASLLPEESSLG
eukprot:gene20464-biopygen17579